MKRVRLLLAAVILAFSLSVLSAPAASAVTVTATPTSASVIVDGEVVVFEAYNIDGNNYFKLRDIAMVITDSTKQFDIDYNAETAAITLIPDMPYTTVGGELSTVQDTEPRAATISSSRVFYGDEEVFLQAYLIHGNNFYKLRDLGALFDFSVMWDGLNRIIKIDTAYRYFEDKTAAFYDATINYDENERYHIMSLTLEPYAYYDKYNDVYAQWASQMNCNFTTYSANRDSALLLDMIEISAQYGVDGFLIDTYDNYARVDEILSELGIPWMPNNAAPYDYSSATLYHPFLSLDREILGAQMATWAFEYAKNTWPNASPSSIGMLAFDYSPLSNYQRFIAGVVNTWRESYRDTVSNLFVIDLLNSGGNIITASTLDNNPDIKYWLVCSYSFNDADGATRAFENRSIVENACIISYADETTIDYWGSYTSNCWKANAYHDIRLYTEPKICALYNMMTGTITADQLWTEWILESAGYSYASLQIPHSILDRFNYTEYLEWVDTTTGMDYFDYPYYGTQFPLYATVPDYYTN